MRKFLWMFVVALMAVTMSSCNSCKKENKSEDVKAPLIVENVYNTDRQQMFTTYGKNYNWFECCILLKDYMDSEECDGSVAGVSNVFQVVTEIDSTSADVHVILYSTTEEAKQIDEKHGFWVGDLPLNDYTFNVTYMQAYEKMMNANCPKPHSRHCVLRHEVGPMPDVNPQYIFGNDQMQVYVDAMTGEVRTNNPAFPEDFKPELGTWINKK